VVELLRAEPEDLSAEVLDFLAHRRMVVDRETRRIVARTIELSSTVRSLSELCRQLYVSRRALGRRFSDRRLPPPSHWLQFSRALRVCLRLQASQLPVAQVARMFGYPDAFTLSNQLVRLIGVRPSDVRDCLGWEWVLEAWVEEERRAGNFFPGAVHMPGRTPSASPPLIPAWGADCAR
jgi:AraC-like DNA-binding protein